ncbi:MAG: MFS transporter, partial [Bacteroidia bacterium]|nr:MFS transporter [Bacteroidia bacterium]
VYPVLCILIGLSFVFLLFSKQNVPVETSGSSLAEDLKNSLGLIVMPLVLVFILSAFFFVMIEQGIMTWLPRFNEKIFSFSEKLSVQMASILAISLALGRFVAGWASKKISWEKIVIVCSVIAIGILLAVLPQLKVDGNAITLRTLGEVPYLGFVLPLIGLFIAPIYPLLNSTVLSHLPKSLHSPMSGLIIIFSALGGTLGSRIVGYLFENIGGVNAFYFLIIPIVLLIISVVIIKRLVARKNEA